MGSIGSHQIAPADHPETKRQEAVQKRLEKRREAKDRKVNKGKETARKEEEMEIRRKSFR